MFTQILEHMTPSHYINAIGLKSVVCALVVIVFLGCTRKHLLTIDRNSEKTFDRQHVFVGYTEYKDHDGFHIGKIGSLFFEDGSILVRALRENESLESFLYANQKEIYNNNKVDWGRYMIVSDTVYFEFVKNIRSGGGIKFARLQWKGVIKGDVVNILPGPEKKYRNSVLQFIFPEAGIMLKQETQKMNIEIDIDKAWINS